MTLYKVKHLPSGLFWKPSRYGNKSNLSKTGKVYHKKPNIESWLTHGGKLFYTDYKKSINNNGFVVENLMNLSTKLEDWKIIELKIIPS